MAPVKIHRNFKISIYKQRLESSLVLQTESIYAIKGRPLVLYHQNQDGDPFIRDRNTSGCGIRHQSNSQTPDCHIS